MGFFEWDLEVDERRENGHRYITLTYRPRRYSVEEMYSDILKKAYANGFGKYLPFLPQHPNCKSDLPEPDWDNL